MDSVEPTKTIEIETMLSHHDKVIQDLSDLINAQWKEIESLKNKLAKTEDKITELEAKAGDERDIATAKPPHW